MLHLHFFHPTSKPCQPQLSPPHPPLASLSRVSDHPSSFDSIVCFPSSRGLLSPNKHAAPTATNHGSSGLLGTSSHSTATHPHHTTTAGTGLGSSHHTGTIGPGPGLGHSSAGVGGHSSCVDSPSSDRSFPSKCERLTLTHPPSFFVCSNRRLGREKHVSSHHNPGVNPGIGSKIAGTVESASRYTFPVMSIRPYFRTLTKSHGHILSPSGGRQDDQQPSQGHRRRSKEGCGSPFHPSPPCASPTSS